MNTILDFIAKETGSKNYKSYKYCIENVEVPKLEYDDKQDIVVKKIGETDKGLKSSKSLKDYANKTLQLSSKNGHFKQLIFHSTFFCIHRASGHLSMSGCAYFYNSRQYTQTASAPARQKFPLPGTRAVHISAC